MCMGVFSARMSVDHMHGVHCPSPWAGTAEVPVTGHMGEHTLGTPRISENQEAES